MFPILELPIELQNNILTLINNTHTICQARLVCQRWNKFWGKIPLFEDGIHLGNFIIKPTHFMLVDLNGKLIREIKFKSYGRWMYQEYFPDGRMLRKIENKSLFMTQNTDNSSQYVQYIRKVDARAGKIHEVTVPRYLAAPQCNIS